MAGHSGGSWKVAYADFVTAMMAFFLVMWIGAQDSKVRQSVANYFVDPSGVSKKPIQTGAALDAMTYGSTPKEQATAMGRGRQSHDAPGEPSPATKSVCDWIQGDDKRARYWREQAQRCRENAVTLAKQAKGRTPEEIAVQELAKQLYTELLGGIPPQNKGIYQDLLLSAINADINWAQIAQDLLAQ
ncbi:flagellar motor protein : Motility protein B, N-terminal domain protein OS=Gemmatimonadetes bacterium KBS708 GN=J421_0225 PE=4 SV=1: MotB_plug [Gemmataceae bacterium]|nr:flagellar motor protein : Motility protein B, N-terminal domain protein OS=Gemmatimonadetes bacterium KBS708 GN=J421_0225 PE=4 SV=1: MotB_plug [Gemmataceae bacterium]VTT97920.1 flagellar motor protein : Motility protein B, N-terminal domain protein OS=Gemmatimonadetes bacterium KBS708 GN=J421_0225 PE=4 SV=1: MotB_plug [Gemmataceae bacterium]